MSSLRRQAPPPITPPPLAWQHAHAVATHGTAVPESDAPTVLAKEQLGSDRTRRRGLFVPASDAHPAKLHLGLVAWLTEHHTAPGEHLVDPMGGIGSDAYAAMFQRDVTIREIEHVWVALAHENAARIVQAAGLFAGHIDVQQGDAQQPWGGVWDVVLCSPPYGCRAAPAHASKVGTLERRRSKIASGVYGSRWRELLDRPTPGSWGAEAFHYGSDAAQLGHLRGASYWQAMARVYDAAHAATRPGGTLILIIKDHIRDGQRVWTTDATIARCEQLGWVLTHRYVRPLTRMALWTRRRREHGLPIIAAEDALVFARFPLREGA